jgi:hypothetical protein
MATIKSFVPMTGRGSFDATYVEGTGLMTITVNVFPKFENRPIEGVRWTTSAQNEFKRTARDAVKEYWNYKYNLVNRQNNPASVVSILFDVRFVESEKEASIIMAVPRYSSAYGPGELARCDSYVGMSQIDTGNPHAKSNAMVHSETTKDVDVSLTESLNVPRDERKRIQGFFGPLGLDAIALDANVDLSPQLLVRLANLSLRIKSGPPSRPLVPIVVKAHFNTRNGTTAGRVAKKTRAIRDKLISFHVRNPVGIDHLNNLDLADAGFIELICDLSFETTFDDKMWMNIFAHEYGHMLGLPDEYDAMPAASDKSSKAIGLNRFGAMCEVHKIPAPVMGAMTSSMMCKGRDILPCHMLPALEAITTITNKSGWTVG